MANQEELPDIEALQRKHLAGGIKMYPQKNLRASSIGHPCDWYLWGSIKHWADAQPHDAGLEAIFEEGRRQEQAVLRDLIEWGCEVKQGQRPLWSDKLQLSAHIECIVKFPSGIELLIEIKSMAPHLFSSVRCVADMVDHERYWIRGYVWQMETYRMLTEEAGIIPPGKPSIWVLKDKSSGLIRDFPQGDDPDLRAQICARAETINTHLDANTEPSKLHDPRVCEGCRLRAVCGPDMKRSGMEFYDDNELTNKLDRLEELKPARDEYDKLDKERKRIFTGVENALVGGRWLVTGKQRSRKGFTVVPSSYWSTTIKKVQET